MHLGPAGPILVQKLAQIGPKTGLHGFYVLNGMYVTSNDQTSKNHKSFKQYSTAGQISLPYNRPGGPNYRPGLPKKAQKEPKLAQKTNWHGFFVLDSI